MAAIAAPPARIERRFMRFLLAVPSSFHVLWQLFGGA
jgi:hypothetical protein